MLKPVQLGNSGLRVSQLCLGTMNFGIPGRGHQGDWTLTMDEARPILKAAIDHGLFYFDCADVYGLGASEEVVGALLKELLPRDEYVLTTKIAMPMGRGANQAGLSRKHVREGIDACLKRLGHDYIDQLVIHRHPHGVPGHVDTPIEETMEALNDAVKAGKVLYLGGSSMFAWQFAQLQMAAEAKWLGEIYFDAESLQSGVPRRRARDEPLLFGHRCRFNALVAVGEGYFGRVVSRRLWWRQH
jgi:aryl-alcohol dehydrogenase-like predicted oxidoreductase